MIPLHPVTEAQVQKLVDDSRAIAERVKEAVTAELSKTTVVGQAAMIGITHGLAELILRILWTYPELLNESTLIRTAAQFSNALCDGIALQALHRRNLAEQETALHIAEQAAGRPQETQH